MKKYGYLSAIPLSFFSADFYRDVAKNWKGGVLLYLLLLITLCWVLLSINVQKVVGTGYKEFSTVFFPQLPELVIKDGELKTPEKRPYMIKDSDNHTIAIIDTTGQYKNLEQAKTDYLVTSHGFFYKSGHQEIKGHFFSEDLNMELKPVEMKAMSEKLVKGAWIIFLPLFIFFSFIYRLIQVALYSILGEIFLIFAKIPLTYGQVFKITIFAITPSMIIGTLFGFFGVTFPLMWLFYFMLSMAYLIFGIRANKE